MIDRLRIFLFALVLACPSIASIAGIAGVAEAQTETATTAKKLPPGFERVAGAPEKEQLDPNPLVIGAYIMFFTMMFGYVIWVARQQAAIAKDMTELAERIKKAEKK